MITLVTQNLCVYTHAAADAYSLSLPYTIVDTGQVRCYDNRTEISYPRLAKRSSVRTPITTATSRLTATTAMAR